MRSMVLKFLSVLALMLSVALALACASGNTAPLPPDTPTVRDISAFYQRLDNATAPQSFINVKDLGQVVYGDFKAPIRLYSIANRSGFRHKVFLEGAIHGNEPAGAETLAQFIESLASHASLYPDIAFEIVPIVNPWGWSHNIRYNRDGKDIHRDFATMSTQEAKIMYSHLRQNRYDLFIDHHEDPDAVGFYLYQYAMPDQMLSRNSIRALKGDGYKAEQNVNMVILKTDDGLIDAPMWGLWYMSVTRQLSLANYARLYNSDTVYTIESPTALPMKDRLNIHIKAQEMMLDDLEER